MKVPFYSRAVFLGIISLCSCASPTPSPIPLPNFQIHGHFSAEQLISSDKGIKHLAELNIKKIQCAKHDPNPIVYISGKVTESITDEKGNKIGGKISWPPTLSVGKSSKNKTKTDITYEVQQLYDLPDHIDFDSTIVAENPKQDNSGISIITALNKSAGSKNFMTQNIKTKRKVQKDLAKLAESRRIGNRTANMMMSITARRFFSLYPYDNRKINGRELEFRLEINKLINNPPSKDECLRLSAG
ncbi:MAG: hypothetical protein ACYDAM_06180 [Leptospirales bacterium]